jgi:PDZ domain
MRTIGLFVLVLFLCGCVSVGRPLNDMAIDQFRIGETTEPEVVAALGQPMSVATADGMSALTYGFVYSAARPETLIPIVGGFVGGADATSRSATFVFSPDGILRHMMRGGSDVHSGVLTGTHIAAGSVSSSVPNAPVVSTPVPIATTRKSLNIEGAMVTPTMAADAQLSPPHGVMVLSVGATGAGMLAGMMPRDVILDFGGVPVNGQSDMQRMLATVKPGSTVVATIWRNNEEKVLTIQF